MHIIKNLKSFAVKTRTRANIGHDSESSVIHLTSQPVHRSYRNCACRQI